MSLKPRVRKSRIGIDAGSDALRRILKLELLLDSETDVTVDLGQITRGRRYAYRANSRLEKTEDVNDKSKHGHNIQSTCEVAPETRCLAEQITEETSGTNSGVEITPPPSPNTAPTATLSPSVVPWEHFADARVHRTSEILKQPGLVASSESGRIHIFPASDPLISLALLGKLYPENVILTDDTERSYEAVARAGKGFGGRLLLWQESGQPGAEDTVQPAVEIS
jgi:hypothetical protein